MVKRMKYPIGIQDFAQIIQDGYVYVDKTDLVYKLATEGKTCSRDLPSTGSRPNGRNILYSISTSTEETTTRMANSINASKDM